MSLTKDLVAEFNVVARIEYNRAYQEFSPKFNDLLYEYESGPVAESSFPFFEFLKGMEEFTGTRTHQTFPSGYKFTVQNKEWDMAVDIYRKDWERASNMGAMRLKGLNPFKLRISEMPKIAKDHPIELAFDMLEAGDASTYGTTFDLQNFFDTTHNYGVVAGTQSNLLTGTGTTEANVEADLSSVAQAFDGFYYAQGGTGNAKRRKLNKNWDGTMRIVCPIGLGETFRKLNTKDRLSNGESNPWKGRLDVVTKHFTDTNDWYAVLVDDPIFRPFLYQVEMPVELDMPTLQDDSYREHKKLSYGAYGRYNVAYGAWWKAIQVANS
ncbi:MAG: Mu-like prophage major head subunit gpT family protein [Candidatus Omnitrophica bacterium]|nr:Mu-like prophage major head subunit gpT family protein [Candidatus Omnitrophota bacterium]